MSAVIAASLLVRDRDRRNSQVRRGSEDVGSQEASSIQALRRSQTLAVPQAGTKMKGGSFAAQHHINSRQSTPGNGTSQHAKQRKDSNSSRRLEISVDPILLPQKPLTPKGPYTGYQQFEVRTPNGRSAQKNDYIVFSTTGDDVASRTFEGGQGQDKGERDREVSSIQLTTVEQQSAELIAEEHRPKVPLLRSESTWDHLDDEEKMQRAVSVLQRRWKRFRLPVLDRRNFEMRLSLEKQLLNGIIRLFLFSLIFQFLVNLTSVGYNTTARLRVQNVLYETLQLENVADIKNIEDFRDRLPLLSQSIKQYAIAGKGRYFDPGSVEVVQQEVSATNPIALPGLTLQIGRLDSFTLTAWVETDKLNAPIIRLPYLSDTSLNCWGWYTNPAALKYGAQDYWREDLLDEKAEVVVEAPGRVETLTHQAVVVNGTSVIFYRNGLPVGDELTLPRPITLCDNTLIELADTGMKISSLKFYARALFMNEIQEMQGRGQTLGELAIGTGLPQFERDDVQSLIRELNTQSETTLRQMEHNQRSSSASRTVLRASERAEQSAEPEINPLFPEDPSPPTALLNGQSSSLSSREQARWVQDGMKMHHNRTEAWRNDSTGDFWQVFEDPLYIDRAGDTHFRMMPSFPDSSQKMTITYWTKSVSSDYYGMGITISDPGPIQFEPTVIPGATMASKSFAFWHTGSYFAAVFNRLVGPDFTWVRQIRCHQITEPATDGRRNRVDETYAIANEYSPPRPNPWRMVGISVDWEERYLMFYLDGVLMMDSREFSWRCAWHDNSPISEHYGPDISEFFSGTTLSVFHTPAQPGCPTSSGVAAKVADLRIYPKLLTQMEWATLHTMSTWPSGSLKQQCVDIATNTQRYDSVRLDSEGHGCRWYGQQKSISPEICDSLTAKDFCPLTCGGFRECLPSPSLKKEKAYRVFDRVMHIVPHNLSDKKGIKTHGAVICPSNKVNKTKVMENCESYVRGPMTEEQAIKYRLFFDINRVWIPTHIRSDVMNCSELVSLIDDSQCQWDSAWTDEFAQEYQQSRTWSIEFWYKATEKSVGMPHSFMASIGFHNSMHDGPMKDLVQHSWAGEYVDETGAIAPISYHPLIPWLAQYTPILNVSCCGEYLTGWTYTYMSLAINEQGIGSLCVAVNAMPVVCTQNRFDLAPHDIFESVEFHTEMLITPIEVRASARTPAQLQQEYYLSLPKMENLRGPAMSEVDWKASSGTKASLDGSSYDEKLIMIAPPLLMQARAAQKVCSSATSVVSLEYQKDLLLNSLCEGLDCGPLQTAEVYYCRGDKYLDEFYDLNVTDFNNQKVFADFLYIVDNPVIVRDGQTLRSREFIDGSTTSTSVLALLQSPETGQIHVLEIKSDFSDVEIQSEVFLQHYHYLDSDQRQEAIIYFSLLSACILLIFIFNVLLLLDSSHQDPEDRKHTVFEVAYDLLQVFVLVVFGIVWIIHVLGSESKAQDIVRDVVSVEFASSELDLQEKMTRFFTAVENLQQELADESVLFVVGFGLFVTMLLRMLKSTGVHPRMGLLTGTFLYALDDLWHFSLMFVFVFYMFAMAASWSFGSFRNDFKDLNSAMATQLDILLGNMPAEYDTGTQKEEMIVYVSLTLIVIYFLCFNFLLAIVVEGYMKVRKEVTENEVEKEILLDIVVTLKHKLTSYIRGWPRDSEVIVVLRKKLASRTVTAAHLKVHGIDFQKAKTMLASYAKIEELKEKTDVPSMYGVAMDAMRTFRPGMSSPSFSASMRSVNLRSTSAPASNGANGAPGSPVRGQSAATVKEDAEQHSS